MERINFNDNDQFARLERLAYSGTLDYTDFPAAEYKYFDKLSELGRSHRAGCLPKDICKEYKEAYLNEYFADRNNLQRNLWAMKKYQDNIRKSDELRCMIDKTESNIEKLGLALKLVELLTGEDGFAERNLK